MRIARLGLLTAALVITGASSYPVPPKAERGKADAACRDGEPGPAARVLVHGLKDRAGKLVLELYPANDADFLASDKTLIAAGKIFRRVEMAAPDDGPVTLCIRAPQPGVYALAILHDRDNNGKFGIFSDGVAFPGDPVVRRSKPRASAAALSLGPGVQAISVTMNYRRGFRFAPLAAGQ